MGEESEYRSTMKRCGPASRRRTALRRPQYRGPALIVIACLVTTLGACGSDEDNTVTPVPIELVRWSDCDLGFQCGTVTVPIDYDHPSAGTLNVAVVRKPATDAAQRIGSLVLNPGGPGLSGVTTLKLLAGALPAPLGERFDLVSFDPRGTAASAKIDCGTDLSALVSAAPVPAADGEPLAVASLYTAMGKACVRAASLLPFVNTINTARDLDRIRQALGDEKLTFLGVSYGTRLGSVYADLFPGHVRALVLDGAIEPSAPIDEQARAQAQAAEAALGRFLNTCKTRPTCQIGPDPAGFYDALLAQLMRQPLPSPGGGDPHPVTAGDLQAATLAAISLPTFYGTQYLEALAAAGKGDGAPLRALSRGLFSDPDGPSEVDAYWTILCADEKEHPSAVAAGALARELEQGSPRVGAYSASYLVAGCADWPVPPRPIPAVRAPGAPPIVVIGTTGDPNTPYPWARSLASALESGVAITREGEGHTWFASGFRNRCVNEIVAAYFVDLEVPADGTTCTAGGTQRP